VTSTLSTPSASSSSPTSLRSSVPLSQSAPSTRNVIIGSVVTGVIALSLLFAIFLLCRRRKRRTPFNIESTFFRNKKTEIVPFPQPPAQKLKTFNSHPRDEKARATRAEEEQQIAAIQRQLNDLRHQSAAASSSDRRGTSTTNHDAEVLSLRQQVEDMKLEIERLTRDRRDSCSLRQLHEPPPQYQPDLQG
jgi:hypothetical protein